MAAMLDLRVFKLGLLVCSIVLMVLGLGVMAFRTTLGMIPPNAVPVLSISVWLTCAFSAIRRWLGSKRPDGPFGNRAVAWMLNPQQED